MAKDSKNGNKSKSRKPDTPVLYQNLVIKQAKVDTADINTWKTAVNSAKSGNRSKLYDLYENLLADPFLSDAINKRTDAIVNAEIAFIKDGQTVEEIDSLIDTVEFENLVREIVLSRAWGKSVIEIMFSPEFHIFSYPRRNIRITNLDKPLAEHKKFLAAKDSDNTGYDYVNDSRIIECGDDYDLGLIYRAAPYVIYKRGGFGDWSQFVEIFGMPLLIGKYSMYDERGREKLMEMLTSMGSNPRAAIPEGTDIEVKPNQSFGSPQLYREFRAACNEEILVAVVGNTMTTVAGSSRSQGEVHQNSEEKINRADRRFVQRTLNRYLLPLLIERGYGAAAGGYFVFPDTGENMTAQERIDLALQIRREGIPVSDDYIYDISGIPKPSGKQAKKPDGKPDGKPADGKEKEQEQKHAAPPEAGTVVLDLEPLTEPERGFFERLLDFFADAPAAWNGAIQNFIAKWNGSTATVTFAEGDTAVDIDAASLFGQALRELYTGSEPAVEKHLFEITDRMLQGGINKTFSRAGLEFGQKNQDFIDQFKYSASVFAAFKNHQQTKEIVALLHDEKGNLRSFSDFRKRAGEVSKDYNQNWLRTEYTTAVRAARSAVDWKQYELTKNAYPNLEYVKSTARDKRETHLEWAGTVLPVDHPWWDTHMPPSDWNCKCSVRRSDGPATPVPAAGEGNPLFANNPGKTAEFVRLQEHPYVKGECSFVGNCDRQNIQLAARPYKPACEICLFAKQYHKNRSRIKSNQVEYEALLKDKNYGDVKFNPKTGGLYAQHRDHQFDKRTGKFERMAAETAFSYGRKIILESERAPDGIKTPDGRMDDAVCDIKSIEGTGKNNIKNKFSEANSQGAETVILFFTGEKYFSVDRIKKGYGMYRGIVKNDRIKNIFYMINSKMYRFL